VVTPRGTIKFVPRFTDYPLEDNNVLLFESGLLVEPSKYTIYNDNYIYFKKKEDRDGAINHYYDLFLPTDIDYVDYLAPVFKFSSIPIDKPNTKVFDIPIMKHMDNSSLIVFRKGTGPIPTITLFYGYSVVSDQIKLNPNTTPLSVGEELILVYFESTISKLSKLYKLIQSSFPASTFNNTIIPDRYLDSDPDKIMLFLNGVLLRRDEFSWDARVRRVKILNTNRLISDSKFSIIQLEESTILY
jgi:hypothetical protein